MLDSIMCCVSSIGRREKGLKEGEGEGEESGGRDEGEVILLDLWEIRESCQHILTHLAYLSSLPTSKRKSCRRSEMRKWEGDRMKGLTPECDLLDYIAISRYPLSVCSSCLIQ